jgi:hypothetical protein
MEHVQIKIFKYLDVPGNVDPVHHGHVRGVKKWIVLVNSVGYTGCRILVFPVKIEIKF